MDNALPLGAASWALGLSKSEVDQTLDEGSLPKGVFMKVNRRRFVARAGLPYVKFSAIQRRRLSLAFRKEMLRQMAAAKRYSWKNELMEVDLAPIKAEVDERLRLLRLAEEWVVIDPEIMGGEPCLKGTRIPVYIVAATQARGVPVADVLRSYPSLTPELIQHASIYGAAYPKRGRPAAPSWRKDAPVARRVVAKKFPGRA
jgi:uncharacterized protein (DUF433 family)